MKRNYNRCKRIASVSPPTRGRGLKPAQAGDENQALEVAPHAGAWIETKLMINPACGCRSPPTRGRGLKPPATEAEKQEVRSPPTRGRGLKHDSATTISIRTGVAPHAGAWIETR